MLTITRQFMRERPRMLTNIWYLSILNHSSKIGVCVVPPLERGIKVALFESKITLVAGKLRERGRIEERSITLEIFESR